MHNNRSLGKLSIAYSQEGFGLTVNTPMEAKEIERRISWLSLAVDYYKNSGKKSEYMDRFSIMYETSIYRAIRGLLLDRSHVDKMKEIYMRLLWK